MISENIKKQEPIKILELFGGIGAPRKALEQLGVPVKSIDYVEIDEKAVRSYNSMFRHEQTTQDIRGWSLKPDILVHGSPCQDFSIAGKQLGADKGSGTRSSLLFETLSIIENFGVWKPKIVIWENVKNVLSKHMIKNFKGYLFEMEKLGYTNSFDVLDAMDFGLPQKRERVFTVSMLGGKSFNFDNMEHKPLLSIKSFLSEYEEQHIMTQPSMVRCLNPVKGLNGRKLDIIVDSCNTITTRQVRFPNAGVIALGNNKYRYLTELECWRLQGFDDKDYYAALQANPGKAGKLNGALYKQAGNSIPVNVLREMFRVLLFERGTEWTM